ncbi:MAG: hypothetical protein AB7O38_27265, partial [Pirellulaceae bacterium]
MLRCALWLGMAAILSTATAQEPEKPAPPSTAAADARFEQFTQRMTNVKLVGQFTVIGKKEDGPLAKEEYTIGRVEKLPAGDKWMFYSRIKYGKHDVEVPLPIDVKWAGATPVITLDDFTIPGLGTFSSR